MSQAAQATAGDTVLFHYTGSLRDGTVFDSSAGRDPLRVTLGSGQVIRGVDEALIGMVPGEEKTVTIAADEAYGPHRPELLHAVQREAIPPEVDLEIGQQLEGRDTSGQQLRVTVVEVAEEIVTLDANHPLAGQDLRFELQLVEIA
ncbi:MAG TPA: peptidylprolyl isomerase [Geminicoccaceae bacterium]|nr:peptidylprolyl isomerase [Geminicoccaceae bacterium]